MRAASSDETVRLFFALWPNTGVRQRLAEHARALHRRLGGRLTRTESIHMTLMFLGETPSARIADLSALTATVSFEPFTLQITQCGCWGHNRVGWVAPARAPLSLVRLADGLQRELASASFPVEARPFSPHITLVRQAHCAQNAEPVPPIDWEVVDFVLVRSELQADGSRYSVLGRWPAPAAA